MTLNSSSAEALSVPAALTQAARTLLQSPLLTDGMDGFRETYAWRGELRALYARTAALNVQIGPGVLRLVLPGAVTDEAGEATVRLEVDDASDRAPVPRWVDGDATGGRGLALVDGLADRWGWSREGTGKRIWCELDRAAEREEAAPTGGDGDGAETYGGFAYEVV